MDQRTVDQRLDGLEPLVGSWADIGSVPRTGWGTVEWHAGGVHLVPWRTDGAAGGRPGVGCRGADGTYVQVYSDDRGGCRIYSMTVEDGVCRVAQLGTPPDRWSATRQ